MGFIIFICSTIILGICLITRATLSLLENKAVKDKEAIKIMNYHRYGLKIQSISYLFIATTLVLAIINYF